MSSDDRYAYEKKEETLVLFFIFTREQHVTAEGAFEKLLFRTDKQL